MSVSNFFALAFGFLLSVTILDTYVLGADADDIRAGKAATALVDLGNEGSGSAFCIRADGVFLTNQHVVGARSVGEDVTLILNPALAEQRSVEARIMKMDPLRDLALLKVSGEQEFPVVELGNDDDLVETQEVIVFGYPFGRLLSPNRSDAPSITINTGRISALRHRGRDLALIQIDAKVNPGNSGGPVLDDDGKVIGVVVSSILGSGVSFAIPVTQVTQFLDAPGIRIDSSQIPFRERFEPQKLNIEVFEYREPSQPLTIKVMSRSSGGEPVTVTATAAGDSYSVAVTPVPKLDRQPELELFALHQGEVFACDTKDVEIRVGRRTFHLEEIFEIEKRPDLSIVTTIYRTKYAGQVQGLPRLVDRDTGEVVPLDDAERIQIYTSSAATEQVPLVVTADRAGETLARFEHALELDAVPLMINPRAESEFDGGLPWRWRRDAPARRILSKYQSADRYDLRWYPLEDGRPFQCLQLGPLPFEFDEGRVFDFIAQTDLNAKLDGKQLTPTLMRGDLFKGPQTPKSLMYYVFFVRTAKPQTVKAQFETFTRWGHSTIDAFIDFRQVDTESSELSLSAGEHIVIVRQNHHRSDVEGRSWIKFSIEGEGIETGLFPALGLARKELYDRFLSNDLSNVTWNDAPQDRLLADAFVLGALPMQHDEAKVFNYLAEFDVDGDWQGHSLTPRKPREEGTGKFNGPLTPQRCQYYMFLIRTAQKSHISWNAQTFSEWGESTADAFLDFVPVATQAEATLSPGVHVFLVRQNHNRSERFERSWISLSVIGSGLEVGSLPDRQTPPSELFVRYQQAGGFKVNWQPLEDSHPQQCLKLGPFPYEYDNQKALEFLAQGDRAAELQGSRLIPAEAIGKQFQGPNSPQTLMYYVFFVRTKKEQTAKVHFDTYWNYQHSWLEVFLDFRPFDSYNKQMPLRAGEHVIVVCQHHFRSDEPKFSWIQFGIEGEELDVGQLPALE